MTYRAVMFDLDGTLLDTIEDLTDSMNHALELQSLPLRTVKECMVFVGDGVEAYARRALPDDRQDQATLDPLYAKLVELDDDVDTVQQASLTADQAILEVRDARRDEGISCTG